MAENGAIGATPMTGWRRHSPTRLLVQAPAGDGISGVASYIAEFVISAEQVGLSVGTLESSASALAKVRAVVEADLVHFNSHDLFMLVVARALRKSTCIKYHWPFWLSTKYDVSRKGPTHRLITEIQYLWTYIQGKRALRERLRAYCRLGLRLTFFRLVGHRVACSEFLAQSIELPGEIRVAYNPISGSCGESAAELVDLSTAQLQKGERSAEPTLLFLGRLVEDKGILTLLDAIPYIESECTILIAGSGELEAQVRSWLARYSGPVKVSILGAVTRARASELLGRVHALIAPSLWQEPAGYVCLEASMASTMSIVSNSGGLPEMVGPTGLTVPVGDHRALAAAVNWVCTNKDAALKMGVSAKRRACQMFDPRVTLEQFANGWPKLRLAMQPEE